MVDVVVKGENWTDGTVIRDMELERARCRRNQASEYPPLFLEAISHLHNHGSLTMVVPPALLAAAKPAISPKVPPNATMVYELRIDNSQAPTKGAKAVKREAGHGGRAGMNTMIKIALFDETVTSAPVGRRLWRCISALTASARCYWMRSRFTKPIWCSAASSPGVQSVFVTFFEAQAAGRQTLYFSLRTPEGRHKRTAGTRCALEAGVIYHDTPLQVGAVSGERRAGAAQQWPGRPSCGMNCGCQHRGLSAARTGDRALHDAGDGRTQIARMLDISVKTVSNHKMKAQQDGFRA
ncbi:hypothetical protein M8494_16960 [Serratia ureilytica]